MTGSDGQELKISFSQYLARANARLSKLSGPHVAWGLCTLAGDGRIRRSRIPTRSDCRLFHKCTSKSIIFIFIYCLSIRFTSLSEPRVCQNGHFARTHCKQGARCLGAKLEGWLVFYLGDVGRPSSALLEHEQAAMALAAALTRFGYRE